MIKTIPNVNLLTLTSPFTNKTLTFQEHSGGAISYLNGDSATSGLEALVVQITEEFDRLSRGISSLEAKLIIIDATISITNANEVPPAFKLYRKEIEEALSKGNALAVQVSKELDDIKTLHYFAKKYDEVQPGTSAPVCHTAAPISIPLGEDSVEAQTSSDIAVLDEFTAKIRSGLLNTPEGRKECVESLPGILGILTNRLGEIGEKQFTPAEIAEPATCLGCSSCQGEGFEGYGQVEISKSDVDFLKAGIEKRVKTGEAFSEGGRVAIKIPQGIGPEKFFQSIIDEEKAAAQQVQSSEAIDVPGLLSKLFSEQFERNSPLEQVLENVVNNLVPAKPTLDRMIADRFKAKAEETESNSIEQTLKNMGFRIQAEPESSKQNTLGELLKSLLGNPKANGSDLRRPAA